MNRLQQLLGQKLAEGKSYRRMEEETGISHNSLSDYHQKGKTPHHGKNLAVLSKYFSVPLEDLLEEAEPRHSPPTRSFASSESDLLDQECADLSRTEQLEVIVWLRKWKQENRQTVC